MRFLIPCLILVPAAQTATARVDSGCLELADPREAGLPTPTGGCPQVICASFFPFAVVMDGSETSRAEVRIIGSGITAVSLGNGIRPVAVLTNRTPSV